MPYKGAPETPVVVKGGERFVVLPSAVLHEVDHQQVMLRAKKDGEKFSDALAGYIKDLREYMMKGEGHMPLDGSQNG
jgi:hypothetical protein